MNKGSLVLKIVAPFAAVGFGILVLVVLVKTRPEVAKAQAQDKAPLVAATVVQAKTHELVVAGHGEVRPARLVNLSPEVGGRIVEMSDQLVPGGRFEAGENMLRINPQDYRLAIGQMQANVENARVNLEVERSRRSIAKREWDLLGARVEGEKNQALALREPYERSAKATLNSAASGLALARTNLNRTTLSAPFNAVVLSENVDVGQVVGPGGPIATLAGTDRFWVHVNIPVERLVHIAIPGVNVAAGEGATARIVADEGKLEVVKSGRVVRLLSQLSPTGRLAQVTVEVDDPLDTSEGQLPLLLGSYVRVEIDGRPIEGVAIPAHALREGNEVFVVNDGALNKTPVEVAWRTEQQVIVSRGLAGGETIVTGRLDPAVDGMGLRTAEAEEPAKDGEGPGEGTAQ